MKTGHGLAAVALTASFTFLTQGGCVTETEPDAEEESTADFVYEPDHDPQSGAGTACRVACAMAGGAGCAAVGVSCSVGTVFTVGGVALPCTWAIVAACSTAAGGVVLCQEKACPL